MVRSPMLFFDFCPLMGLYSEITEVHPPHYCACLCGLRPYPSQLWGPQHPLGVCASLWGKRVWSGGCGRPRGG